MITGEGIPHNDGNGDKLSSTIYKANVIDEPLGVWNSDRILEREVVIEKVE